MHIEQIQIEGERFARRDRPAVQMSCSKYEWTGPVREPAWSVSQRGWLEHSGIGACGPQLTRAGVTAVRNARNATEDHTESAAQNIGRLTGGKMYRLACDEHKSERIEPKLQASIVSLDFQFPRTTILSRQILPRFLLRTFPALCVPSEASLAAQRHVAEQASCGGALADFDIGNRLLARANAFEEIRPMIRVAAVSRLHFARFHVRFLLGNDAIPSAIDEQRPFLTMKQNAVIMIEQ